MHQVSLETICPLKAFQLHYCPENNAKSMVKHFIFLQKFAVLTFCDHHWWRRRQYGATQGFIFSGAHTLTGGASLVFYLQGAPLQNGQGGGSGLASPTCHP